MELYKLTAHELHDKLVNKEVSSVELTNALYARIDEVEDKVNAYVTLDKENALAQAAKVDAKIAAGEAIAPLAGVPGAIKDNICTKGLLTTCSSKMLSNVVPIYDAHVIKNLRADETIFLGKTNMDEFAMGSTTETSYYGPTHNPWNLERVPGGSSGGSAAAIIRDSTLAAMLLRLLLAKHFGLWAPIPAAPFVNRLPSTAALALSPPMAVYPVMAA